MAVVLLRDLASMPLDALMSDMSTAVARVALAGAFVGCLAALITDDAYSSVLRWVRRRRRAGLRVSL